MVNASDIVVQVAPASARLTIRITGYPGNMSDEPEISSDIEKICLTCTVHLIHSDLFISGTQLADMVLLNLLADNQFCGVYA